MFIQTWKKYLPVIILLMKRSDKGEQILNMNATDFQRAAGGKKMKLTFSDLKLKNGRSNLDIKQAALATDLTSLLLQDNKSRLMMQSQVYEFSMNSEFQLLIKNSTPAL